MRDPIVRDVLALYRACRTDSGATPALVLPTDPPNVLWDGLLHYAASVDRMRANEMKLAREERERKHPKR